MAFPMQTHADNLNSSTPTLVSNGVLRSADDFAGRLLRMTQSLQTTLEVPALLELFHLQCENNVPLDGIEFVNDDLDMEYRVGTRARNTCSYNLILDETNLGQLLFRRRSKFSEDEAAVLEKLLCCLLYPLRNALLYRNALSLAQKDSLTGICNRAAFDDSLRAEVNLARRHGTPLSLVVFDIDHFKSINDRFGHSKGDEAIRAVVHCAQHCARSTDILFRYGGEEFVMLLRNTDTHGARLLADRIRRKVEKLDCQSGKKPIAMTVSAGVASLRADDHALALFEQADAALYSAKNGGRNQVAVAE